MANKNPQQVAEKYQRRMAAAGPDYEAGVRNPSRPWEQATAEGAARWAAGVNEAISRGSFAKGVVGKGEKWTRKVTSVGVQRYQGAAQSAAQEYGAVADKIMNIANASSQRARSMPGTTLEERLNKARENALFIREQWKRSG